MSVCIISVVQVFWSRILLLSELLSQPHLFSWPCLTMMCWIFKDAVAPQWYLTRNLFLNSFCMKDIIWYTGLFLFSFTFGRFLVGYDLDTFSSLVWYSFLYQAFLLCSNTNQFLSFRVSSAIFEILGPVLIVCKGLTSLRFYCSFLNLKLTFLEEAVKEMTWPWEKGRNDLTSEWTPPNKFNHKWNEMNFRMTKL